MTAPLSTPTALDVLLMKAIQINGVAVPIRAALNFLGTISWSDNAANNSTDVTLSGGGGGSGVSTLSANFTQPAIAATVVASVASSTGYAVGVTVYIAGGGFYTITAIPGSTSLTLDNVGALSNVTPGTVVTSGALVIPSGPAIGVAGGDLGGTLPNPSVLRANGATIPAAGSLVTGNVLQVSGASALSYGPVNLAGGANYVSGILPAANQAAQTLAGDVTGTTAASVVGKIQGNTVTAGALAIGLFLIATSTTNWAATALSRDVSSSGTTAGQLTVTGLQGNPIQAATYGAGQDGMVLTWVNASTQLQLRAVTGLPSGTGLVRVDTGSGSVIADGTADQLFGRNHANTADAFFTLGGDGSIASNNLTVSKINSASVPAGGSLTTGNVLQVTGASALGYAAVNLGGGANFVTGTLPAANQASQTMAGDVTGTTAASVVAKANGATVPAAGALTTGNVLQVSGASALTYAALNLGGGANYVTGTLPAGNQAAQTLTGDVVGNTGANTCTLAGDVTGRTGVTVVAKINGTSVSATPGANTVLTATSGTVSAWATLVNANISASAAIAVSKLAAGTSAQVLLNNATPTPTWTTLSSDVTISSSGATTVNSISGTSPIAITPSVMQYAQATVTPTWSQLQQANGAAPQSFKYLAQIPGAAATNATNGTPGGYIFDVGVPVNGGTEATLVFSRNGVMMCQFEGGAHGMLRFDGSATGANSGNRIQGAGPQLLLSASTSGFSFGVDGVGNGLVTLTSSLVLAVKQNFSATLAATAAGDIGMDLAGGTASGRPQVFVDGVVHGLSAWRADVGDGSDGAATCDGSTAVAGMSRSSLVYTLTRDCYFTTLTINATVTVVSAGFRLFVRDKLTHNGVSINADGAAGAVTAGGGQFSTNTLGGGAAGGAGAASPVAGSAAIKSIGGSGGAGGNTGAAGGTATAPTAVQGSIRQAPEAVTGVIQSQNSNGNPTFYTVMGGAGGGGGTGTNGGGGGGGAGIVGIYTRVLTGNGPITAKGGNGANAGATSGGGGGGGGGGVLLVVGDKSSWTGSLTVTGGTAGTSTSGGAAVAGSAGTAITIMA